MLALAADENFNNDIVRGVLRRNPENLLKKQPIEVTAAVNDAQHLDLLGFRQAVQDNVVTERKAAIARSKVLALPPQIRISRESGEKGGEPVEEVFGALDALALPGDVEPDLVEVHFRLGRDEEVGHLKSAVRAPYLCCI